MMHGDFSRVSFQPEKDFLRVLQLQGRPLLEADANEQTAILLHYLRALAADILGPSAAIDDDAFRISRANNQLLIHPGVLYVDGVRVVNAGRPQTGGGRGPIRFDEQPYIPPDTNAAMTGALVYLDVFERSVFPAEDPSYTEPALDGTATSLRSRLVWQVKTEPNRPPNHTFPGTPNTALKEWAGWVELWQPPDRGTLTVRLQAGGGAGAAACTVPPDAAFRGLYNQLYRVEVHTGGDWQTATFKWSCENGAQVLAVQPLEAGAPVSAVVAPQHPHTVDWPLWGKGTWVEILTADVLRTGSPGQLTQISAPAQRNGQITLADTPDAAVVMLRRWDTAFDQARRDRLTRADDNAAKLEGGKWLPLEHGIEVQFARATVYRSGDYWLLPSRTATDDLLWDRDASGAYIAQLPHGVQHHYAPLALLQDDGSVVNLRLVLKRGNLF